MTTAEIDQQIAALQAQKDKAELQAALDKIAWLEQQLTVHQERLRKAMDREKQLQQQVATIPELQKQILAMREHPDVKAAARAQIAQQINELQRRHKELQETPE